MQYNTKINIDKYYNFLHNQMNNAIKRIDLFISMNADINYQ